MAVTLDHYGELVACLETLGQVRDAVCAREKLAAALARMARYDQALAVLEQAVGALQGAADLVGVLRVETSLAGMYLSMGAYPAGIARLQPVVAALESSGPSADLAAAYLALARLCVQNGQPDRTLAFAVRGEAIARAVGDRACLVYALADRAYGCFMASRVDEALQLAEQAVALSQPEDRWWPWLLLAWIYEERGEYLQGRQTAEHLLVLVEGAHDPWGIVSTMSRLGLAAFLTGDWSAAHAYLERGMAVACEAGYVRGSAYATPRCDLGRLLHAEGDWEEAARHFQDVLAAYSGTGERIQTLVAHAHLAERDVLEGRPEAACVRLLPLLDSPGQEHRMVTHFILPVLAWAQLETGHVDQAATTVSAAIERSRRNICRLAWAQALRVQALVLLKQARWDEAKQAIEEGLALTRSMPYPHGEGQLLAVYGRLYLARGDATATRACLEAALASFRRLGARADIESAEQLLATLG